MKAAVCHEFGRPLVVEEVEIDPPESGEVQVRIAACAICHSDIIYANGGWGGPLPAIYGHEAAEWWRQSVPEWSWSSRATRGGHSDSGLWALLLLPERRADSMPHSLRAR